MRTIENTLYIAAIIAVICLFGTADAWETGAIGGLQFLGQFVLFGSITTATGLGAYVLERRSQAW